MDAWHSPVDKAPKPGGAHPENVKFFHFPVGSVPTFFHLNVFFTTTVDLPFKESTDHGL